MDVFAHTLWTNAVFHFKYHNNRKMRYLAAFFGVAPDLVGFTPVFIYLVLSGKIFFGERFAYMADSNWTYRFAEQAYNYTHSLVVFSFCFLLVLLIGNLYLRVKRGPLFRGWFFWPMLGWALHILIDIPTHPHFYSTPLLFPISSFENHRGIPWSDPMFMVVNYSLLAIVYIGLFYFQKKKLKHAQKK